MNYPSHIPLLQIFNTVNLTTMDLVYWLAVLIPLVMMPIVLPMVVLMARRKRLTDNPNARKAQNRPVPVMGGTVIMLVICVTSVIINIFYDMGNLFPVVCVMTILYIFGMLDDIIGLSWQFKFCLQVLVIMLLFFGCNYGVHTFYGLFGIETMPLWADCLVTLFSGLLFLNAVNFADGIDGLASGIGLLAGLVMGYWNYRHDYETQAILSFIMVGVLFTFFIFNVFSKRYKMYMGDSGSLVLGLFIFLMACPEPAMVGAREFLADNYIVSFLTALLSAIIFDLLRVATARVLEGKSPFHPDRTHLHHILVDVGLSHLLATLWIIFGNLIVLGIWYLTASMGMNANLQFLVVILTAVAVFWGKYYHIVYLREHKPKRYSRLAARCRLASNRADKFSNLITRIIDGGPRQIIKHSIE